MSHYTAKQEARFWQKVNRTENENECWEWQGHRERDHYGIVSLNYKSQKTHRIAYLFTYGEIPEGLVVCHHCDNPPCCNPKHLFLGTHADNVADMHSKGRARGNSITGSTRNGCKLTLNQINEIRSLYSTGRYPLRVIARQYGIAFSHVHRIVTKQAWPDD